MVGILSIWKDKQRWEGSLSTDVIMCLMTKDVEMKEYIISIYHTILQCLLHLNMCDTTTRSPAYLKVSVYTNIFDIR